MGYLLECEGVGSDIPPGMADQPEGQNSSRWQLASTNSEDGDAAPRQFNLAHEF
jgi:hypothetical protein